MFKVISHLTLCPSPFSLLPSPFSLKGKGWGRVGAGSGEGRCRWCILKLLCPYINLELPFKLLFWTWPSPNSIPTNISFKGLFILNFDLSTLFNLVLRLLLFKFRLNPPTFSQLQLAASAGTHRGRFCSIY